MTQADSAATTIEHQIGPRGRFVLRQAAGEVSVHGVEGDRVRVRSMDERSLAEQFDIEIGDGFVELRQRERVALGLKLFSRGGSPEIAVEVPHGASVSIETASADIEATDLSGVKQFRTASGEISLQRLAGPVDIQSVSGDVDLDGQAPIELALRSVSGDAHIRVPRIRRLDATTTSGDLWLDSELSGDGPFALRSISGDVTIVARAGFRVEAESITGDLSSELPAKRESTAGRKILIVGRPGPTLSFRSVSGDLEIVQPREAAPTVVTPISHADAPAVPERPEPPVLSDRGLRDTQHTNAEGPRPPVDADAKRLEILRDLERGAITVAEATQRLGDLD